MPYVPNAWVDNSVPAISAANLLKMEAGIAASPYGPDGASGFVPVGNGSGAWVYKKITDAEIDPAAAIAYSKLALAGQIKNADIASAAGIAPSKFSGYPTDATKFLNGLSQWVNPLPKYHAGLMTVNSTVSPTDLFQGGITIAASDIKQNGTLFVSADGDWMQNSGGAAAPPRFQVVFGGVTILDTGTAGTVANVTLVRMAWHIEIVIRSLNNVNTQWARISGRISVKTIGAVGATDFTTGEGKYGSVGDGTNTPFFDFNGAAFTTAGINSSLALALNVINGSASASYETKLYSALAEIHN